MITISIGLGWFILIVAATAIGSCLFATWASFSLERREIAREQLKITVSKGILHHRQDIHDERHRMLYEREEAESEREARRRRLEHDLGQAAHDMAMQTNLAIHQTMEDTVIIIPELEP